jgi:hypothetical protein
MSSRTEKGKAKVNIKDSGTEIGIADYNIRITHQGPLDATAMDDPARMSIPSRTPELSGTIKVPDYDAVVRKELIIETEAGIITFSVKDRNGGFTVHDWQSVSD